MKDVFLSVSTEKGLFLFSSDLERNNWEMRGPLLKGWSVSDTLFDFRKKPRIYAAVNSPFYGPGIHLSEDLGDSWREIKNPPQYPQDSPYEIESIWTIVPGTRDQPDTFYTGVDPAGIFVSHDCGEHWELLDGLSGHPSREEWMGGKGGLCCHSVLVDPQNPARLWAGISAVGVFRSDDDGKTWSTKNEGLEIVIEGKTHKEIGSCVHRLILDPTNSEKLYQQNHRGVFRSNDAGDTWQRIESGLPHKFGFPMVINPNDPGTLFIVPQESDEYRVIPDGNLRVYRSVDSGDTWQALTNGLPQQSFTGVLRQAMTVDGLDRCGVYFGTISGQVHYSTNNGDQWQTLPCQLPRINAVSVFIK
ncbi:MAG: exo-alpha-sialidase [Candidatus Nitronauta litoralis]|uniref:Exo-alpha-sialidase n=1 Tax=Candidatus Nitronauta litoralis TaxID=2705533 RepID=A0A7T0BZT1_9BACT|nr:MAG: exo-alpha-sialidase [Candidatus Nitronauta litoralis]